MKNIKSQNGGKKMIVYKIVPVINTIWVTDEDIPSVNMSHISKCLCFISFFFTFPKFVIFGFDMAFKIIIIFIFLFIFSHFSLFWRHHRNAQLCLDLTVNITRFSVGNKREYDILCSFLLPVLIILLAQITFRTST